LKLTATGNLCRAVVEEMCRAIKCPGYDKGELFRYQKVVNETDFLPPHFLRILTQSAKLIRTHRGKFIPMPLGRRMLALEHYGPLQALLFHITFWHIKPCLFQPIRAQFLASDPSGCHPLVFRRRPTIGIRERHSRGFARLP